jgi:hypothetical protein
MLICASARSPNTGFLSLAGKWSQGDNLTDAPFWQSNRTRFDAFYVQDQWTRGRLTLQGGLRYEHAWSRYPEGENGIVADNRFGSRYIFPHQDGVTGYHDITPRMGAAIDLFGTGRTSLKVSVSKFLQAANNDAQYTIANPAVTFQQTTNRSWSDANANYVVDCNLMNPVTEDNRAGGGDFCGPWQNLNFGNPFSTTTVNPDVLHGWGVRPYDWQYTASTSTSSCRVSRPMWPTVTGCGATISSPTIGRSGRRTSTSPPSPRRAIPVCPAAADIR